MAADSFAFSVLDLPGSISTTPYDINDAGHIVGAFDTVDPHAALGFLLTNERVVLLRFPDSIVTVAYGINDLDQIVGAAVGDRYAPGFLYASGTFTPIQFLGGDDYTEALDINNRGQIVGAFAGGGFVLTDGQFDTLNIADTLPYGINDAGHIVGGLGPYGFVYDGTTTTILYVPGSTHTEARGINDAGDVVGSFS